MAKKMSAQEHMALADKFTQKAKEERAKAENIRKKEEAALNVKILKAVEEWRLSFDEPFEKEELPEIFRELAKDHSEKAHEDVFWKGERI